MSKFAGYFSDSNFNGVVAGGEGYLADKEEMIALLKEYNDSAAKKTKEFDTNYEQKLNNFNSNAAQKTNEFNANSVKKLAEYNENSAEKIAEFDEHAESIEKELDWLKSIQDTAKASGENVYFDNAKNYPLMSLKGEGKSEQVTTTGKNLLPVTAKTNTGNGITFKINDNKSITISGTATAKANIILDMTERTLNAGSYTISTGLSQKIGVSLGIQIDDTYYSTDTSKLIELSANATFKKWYIDVESGKTVNTTIYPMLYEGTEEKPYEPYTGLQPSPNPAYPQEIKTIQAYNLFDKFHSNVLNGFLDHVSNVFTSGDSAKTLCFACKENTTYTISKKSSERFRIAISSSIPNSGDKLNIKNYDNKSSVTVTTNASDKYILIYYYSSNYDTLTEQEILDSIQITNGYILYKGIGINLINPADLINNADINVLTGVEVSSGGKRTISTVFYEIDPNESYCFRRPHATSNAGLRCYDSNYNFLGIHNIGTGASYLFTTPFDNTKYIKFIDEGNTLDEGYFLAKSDAILPFKPYQESRLEIDLQGNELASVGTVSDKLLIDRKGNVAIEKNIQKLVFDGTEINWTSSKDSNGAVFFLHASDITKKGKKWFQIKSDYFPSVAGWNNPSVKNCIYSGGAGFSITIQKENITTVTDFRTWLNEHNTTVYFNLATPELINLGTIENPEIFKGVNNIVVETNLGNMNIEVEYVEDTRKVFEERLNDLQTQILSIAGGEQ